MKIIADDKIPYIQGVFEPFAEVVYLKGDRISNRDLKDADALLTRSVTMCDEKLLNGTSVKFIASATIGEDHIDANYCREAGIGWAAAKGCNAGAVDQYVQAALVSLAGFLKTDLEGRTLGVVGVGNVGSRVAASARLLGMKVLLNDPPRERTEGKKIFCSLEQIRAEADIISLHVPLTFGGPDKTFHLVDRTFFEGLRNPVSLINTSRGAVVESEALKFAAEEGKVSAMVLDVWENEPCPDAELISSAGIATPHIAGYSFEGKATASTMTVQAVSRFFSLPLTGWTADAEKKGSELSVDCAGDERMQVLSGVYGRVLPLAGITEDLKKSPEDFEGLRGRYTFRNENPGCILELQDCKDETKHLLAGLGFSIKINE